MSVDVEGMDLEVLQGNDWGRYRPEILLVECVGATLRNVDGSQMGRFLLEQGYEIFGRTVHTFFFKDARREAGKS